MEACVSVWWHVPPPMHGHFNVRRQNIIARLVYEQPNTSAGILFEEAFRPLSASRMVSSSLGGGSAGSLTPAAPAVVELKRELPTATFGSSPVQHFATARAESSSLSPNKGSMYMPVS